MLKEKGRIAFIPSEMDLDRMMLAMIVEEKEDMQKHIMYSDGYAIPARLNAYWFDGRVNRLSSKKDRVGMLNGMERTILLHF